MDLSPSMRNIAIYEFRNAKRVIDRFHIQKLACDAIQEMRIKHRWEALDKEHDRKLWLKSTGEDLPAEVRATASKTVAAGTQVTIQAISASGYSFERWSDSNNNGTRTITVNSDLNLTASFGIGD